MLDSLLSCGIIGGPESRHFMSELQMLVSYPFYTLILNIIPYTYAPVAGVIVFYLLTRRVCTEFHKYYMWAVVRLSKRSALVWKDDTCIHSATMCHIVLQCIQKCL